MESTEKIYDSPVGNVKSHIEQYLKSNGQKGYMWRGYPSLLLTTRGRKTGKLRRTALIYGQEGQTYIIVASNRGAPRNPAWYYNLLAHPEAEIRVRSEVFSVVARQATPEEKQRLWPKMAKIYPPYDYYKSKTSRNIPVIILEKAKTQPGSL